MVRDSTLYISLLMPPDLLTNPMEPGRYSLHATMFSKVPAVSPMRKAPACCRETRRAQKRSVCSPETSQQRGAL